MVPLRFHVSQQPKFGDRHLYGGLSRFIPPAVAAQFEQVADGGLTDAHPGQRAADLPPPATTTRLRLGSAWD